MATIYIPVEVPDSELVKYLGGDYPIGAKVTVGGIEFTKHSDLPFPTQPGQQYTRTESEFGYQVQQAPAQADPWAASPATGAPSTAVAPTQGFTPQATAAPSTPQVVQHLCEHNQPMKLVPAGYSQAKGKAYAAFWACAQPRGAQCGKRVSA